MFSFIFTCLLSLSVFADSDSCSTSCSGSKDVNIDVGGQCMCIGQKCFKVGIGAQGAGMTSNGFGVLGEAKGELYQSKASDSTSYDNDAVAMGIFANDKTGKWIHKPANCVNAESYRTAGCIAVPCENWPLIKQAMKDKKTLAVCRGNSHSDGSTPKNYNSPSGTTPTGQ